MHRNVLPLKNRRAFLKNGLWLLTAPAILRATPPGVRNSGYMGELKGPSSGDVLSGLVGAWKFNEGSGTTAADWSGSGYNLTLNTASWSGGGMSCDGGGTKYASIANASCPNLAANSVSVMGWINTSDWTNTFCLLSKGNLSAADNSYVLEWLGSPGASNEHVFIGGGGLNQNQYSGSITNPANNTWHHICATIAGAGITTFYFDATSQGTSSVGWQYVSNVYNFIVAKDNGGADNLSGLVKGVRVYNRVLSGSEITTIFNLGGI